jgi:hypothetical protein
MRCLTSATWLTSGKFKSFCAKTVPPIPRIAKQRANGLRASVFIILRAVGDYTSQILGTPLPDNYKISLGCSDTDRDAIRFMITVI